MKTNIKKTIASWLANHSCLPCRKKIVSINTKDHFKSVLCAATAFFVLVTSRQPVFQNCSEIFFICCPNAKKPQNCFLFYIWLFFCYLSIIIANHTCYAMGRQGELLVKFLFTQLSSLSVSSHSDGVYYVWGLPHIYEVTMFILHRVGYIYLKLSNQVHKASIVFLHSIVALARARQNVMFIQLVSCIKLNKKTF